jgi:hypothetical protein
MKEMYGRIAVEVSNDKLTELCARHIPGFSAERYRVVAIRLFAAGEVMMTIFAEDRMNRSTSLHQGKIPVKKFKKQLTTASELYEFFNAYNFTISDGDYQLEEMEVTNK